MTIVLNVKLVFKWKWQWNISPKQIETTQYLELILIFVNLINFNWRRQFLFYYFYLWIFTIHVCILVKSKDVVFNMFKCFKFVVEILKEMKIKILHSDTGGEYFPIEVSLHCKRMTLYIQIVHPIPPQQCSLA